MKHTEEDFQNFEVFDTAAFEQPPDARHLTRKNKHFGLFKQQYDRNLQAVLTKCEEDDDLLIRDELLHYYSEQNKIRGERKPHPSPRRSTSPAPPPPPPALSPSSVHPVGGRLKLPSKQKMMLAKDGVLRKAELGEASPLNFLSFRDSYEDTKQQDIDLLEKDQQWRTRIRQYGRWYLSPKHYKSKLQNKPGGKHPDAIRAHQDYQQTLMDASLEPPSA